MVLARIASAVLSIRMMCSFVTLEKKLSFLRIYPLGDVLSAAACSLLLVLAANTATASQFQLSWFNGAQTRSIIPLQDEAGGTAQTASAYYSYNTPNGASANTPDNLEISSVLQVFLYQGPNGISLFQINDRAMDGSGLSVTTALTSTGLAGESLDFVVSDDPSELADGWDTATGSATIEHQSVACCTDGYVLGYLPNAVGDSWSINIDIQPGVTGLNSLSVRTLAAPYAGDATKQIDRIDLPFNDVFGSGGFTISRVAESGNMDAPAIPAPVALALLLPGLAATVAIRRR